MSGIATATLLPDKPRRPQNQVGSRGSLAERFMKKVSPEPNSGCWLWFGSIDRKGYGQIREAGGTRLRVATHVALELAGRTLSSGQQVLHHCDVPACVNPDHLFIGTPRDNTQDMLRKGRGSKPPVAKEREACLRGHPLSEGNLYFCGGVRRCRECHNVRIAARRAAFIAQGLTRDGKPRQ
jgi:hypothetical protein